MIDIQDAVAVASLLADRMLADASKTPEGAEIVAKANQLVAAGAHLELKFAFAGDLIEVAIGVRADTGTLHQIGSVTLHKKTGAMH